MVYVVTFGRRTKRDAKDGETGDRGKIRRLTAGPGEKEDKTCQKKTGNGVGKPHAL